MKYVLKRKSGELPERISRFKSELNEEQYTVVTAPPKASLVVAGAGTGKTRAITYRVAHLIEQGVAAQRILLATFTNRAAREMIRRVSTLTGSQNVHRIFGGTFHRIGNLILRRHAASIGYDSNYSILDAEDARDLLNLCIEDAAIDTKAKRFPKAEVLQDIISFANNTDTPISEIVIDKYPYFEPLTHEIARVDAVYRTRKVDRNVMDYDDLLLNWRRILMEKGEIAALYQEQFQHILVDEYQDTNRLQAEIIDLLAKKHRNVMVVGDDAQSIFGWRGAEFKNIYEFSDRYPEAALYKLETNYRSTPEILDLANVSIAGNKRQFPKLLKAVKRSRGVKPALVPCSDVEQQSAFVAARVLELRDSGTGLDEMAVIYRSHYHSVELQLELSRRGIPYRVQSGLRFFEQAHIKDVVSYLRILVNPRDELAWKRVLKLIPGIGNTTANRVFEAIANEIRASHSPAAVEGSSTFIQAGSLAAQSIPRLRSSEPFRDFIIMLEYLASNEVRNDPARQISIILERGYEQYLQENFENAELRAEDIRGLSLYAQRYDSTETFLGELALLSTERFSGPTPLVGEEVVEGGEDDELLTLTSVHQAKGLEWKAVFLIWAADGKFPSPRSLRDIEGEEEERRLWYVSITRAKDELYIVYPLLTTDFNRQAVLQKPSRFVTECPPALFEVWDLEDESLPEDAPVKLTDGGQDYLN